MGDKIPAYISELLYRHNCVIVPGFGGFVARHIPSGIFNSGSLITPPGKSVLFNKNLQNNDGLLANYLMEKHLISYAEASRQLTNFAETCKQRLESSRRLEIEQIGVLYLDQEKNVQFEPQADVNYLISSFGLGSVYAQPLLSAEPEMTLNENQTEFIDRQSAPVKTKKRKNYRRIAAIVVGTQIVLAGIIISSQRITPGNTAWANLNPFIKPICRVYKPLVKRQVFKKYVPDMQELLLPNTEGYANIKPEENTEMRLVVNISAPAKVDKTAVKKSSGLKKYTLSTSGSYQIVLGCFTIPENAERHIQKLQAQHIPAMLNGTNKKGLHVVSGGSFHTLEEARQALVRIRQNYPHAWLMTGE